MVFGASHALGDKNHVLRAQLQPLQHIKVSFLLKSELGTLTGSEPLPPVLAIAGDRLMAGLYLNELVLKLCPRQDADNELYQRLLAARSELAGSMPLAWLVRRFERDLIQHLGYMTPWSATANGTDIEPERHYRAYPELGLIPAKAEEPGVLSGIDLLDFNADRMPSLPALGALRQLMHGVIAMHLGKSLPRSWQMIGELSRPMKP